jgi:hypothetical protein
MRKQDPSKSYLGELCKHGHTYNGSDCSLRNIKSNACVECERVRQRQPAHLDKKKEYYLKNRDKMIAKNSEKKEYYREYYYSNKDNILERAKEKRRKEKEGKEPKPRKPREKKEKSPVNLVLRRLYYRLYYKRKKEARNGELNG